MLLDLAVSPLFAWDVFTAVLGRELGVDGSALAVVFAVGLFTFMLGVVGGGRAADRVAPRRLALVAGAGVVAGLLGSAVADSVITLLVAFGIVLGAATGLGYATAVRVAGTASSGRGLALGLVVSAYALGTSVLAPVAAGLLDALGRAGTFVALAVALGALLALAAALVPGTRPSRATPTAGAPRDPKIVLLWLAFALGSAPALAAFGHAGALAGPLAGAALAVALLNIGNFVGRLAAGPLSDRVGRPAGLHANAALLLVTCLVLGTLGGVTALVALLVLGLQYGALSVLTPAATADVVPPERFGTTYGLVFTGWGLAGLGAPVATAAAATAVGYDGVYLGFAAIALVMWAAVVVFTRAGGAPPPRPRPRGPRSPADP